jgi:glycerol-3-phosphate acyltransferase PlsY
MTDVWGVVGAAAVGYVAGTFPSADVVTRVVTRGRVDIREEGSGNPGGLNAIRVVGRVWGVVVIVLDAAKGALSALAGWAIAGEAGAYAGAAAAIVGHCFPVWQRFRGGRGVATAGGSFFVVFPPMVPIGGLVALGSSIVLGTRRGIWATCAVWLAGAVLWTAADWSNAWGPDPGLGLVLYSVVGAAVVLWRFRPSARGEVVAS